MTDHPLESDVPAAAVRTMLKSQYRAGLEMLRDAIARCPEDLWYDTRPVNAFWQIAYHSLYFTHMYLQPGYDAFVPWEKEQSNVQHPDAIPGAADPNSTLPLIADPYSKEDVLEYCAFCEGLVDEAVDALDLNAPECGFYWYRMPKLEHQIVNVRHLQHHTAQLASRIREATGGGVRWVQGRPAP
jgi:hypothetical protein